MQTVLPGLEPQQERESRREETHESVPEREHVFRSCECDIAGFLLAVVLFCVRCKQALLYLLDDLQGKWEAGEFAGSSRENTRGREGGLTSGMDAEFTPCTNDALSSLGGPVGALDATTVSPTKRRNDSESSSRPPGGKRSRSVVTVE